jgi:outer membrane protein TolC
LRLADEGLASAEEVRRWTERRREAGEADAIDARVAEGDLAGARQAHSRAAQDARLARIDLAIVSGRSVGESLDVEAALPALREAPSLEASLRDAEANHPELRVRLAALEEMRAQVELADREARPEPTIGASIAREGSAGSPANLIAMGNVSVALPFAQRNRNERARARANVSVAEAEVEGERRGIAAEVERAWQSLRGARERLDIASQAAETIGDAIALVRRGVEAGELAITQIGPTRDRLLAVRSDVIDARREYEQAWIELERATGGEGVR